MRQLKKLSIKIGHLCRSYREHKCLWMFFLPLLSVLLVMQFFRPLNISYEVYHIGMLGIVESTCYSLICLCLFLFVINISIVKKGYQKGIAKLSKNDRKFLRKKSVKKSYNYRIVTACIYIGVLIGNYAVIYSLLPAPAWSSEHVLSIGDALYFSVMTITTVGYGDISPLSWYAKFLTVFEVFSGIILIAVNLAFYMTHAGSKNSAD